MFGIKMRSRKPNRLFSPPSLFILSLAAIGTAALIGKSCGDKEECK
ncbi:hypothetical protein [Desulfosporosinus youngiae]|uniref:Uncharacterized protein n=1 Tax=Desulfosporosinus youngiae DSM 17734 TaxID=768710 RepID=H5XVW8_9FIRM|nr:hypothetical protein [Desulfosporosinus youngiae]EHQ90274.1 hypothetical protein DesyoDRAFT_3243 [Desulfosporosinus youngiae DSM 17734]